MAGRAESLSKERIVQAAICILDADGEKALTFRALAADLATGAGAIYWHVADKSELLAAATDAVVAPAMANVKGDGPPREMIRRTALELFDAIDAHGWVGAHLFDRPEQAAMAQIWEGVGKQLQALGVSERRQFDCASTVVSYIVGVAGQNAANARRVTADRSAFLAAVATRWEQLDPTAYPFLHQMAAQLRDHDDREQYVNGLDLILAGIETVG
jgi:AcrR family transcriptional regulator